MLSGEEVRISDPVFFIISVSSFFVSGKLRKKEVKSIKKKKEIKKIINRIKKMIFVFFIFLE